MRGSCFRLLVNWDRVEVRLPLFREHDLHEAGGCQVVNIKGSQSEGPGFDPPHRRSIFLLQSLTEPKAIVRQEWWVTINDHTVKHKTGRSN